MKTENFVRSINEVKEKNQLDLSAGQDLSIGLMNIVSLEEHAFFSYVKTNDEKFLKVLDAARELRKKLLVKIVKKDDSETWCMSKHLLASSMRLYEVGNRLFHDGKWNEAKEMYKDAAELYGMFWSLNLGYKDLKDTKIASNPVSFKKEEEKSIFSSIKKMLECCKE